MEGDRNLEVTELDYEAEPRVVVTDTLIWHDRLEQEESNVKVSAYRNINGKSYYISTYGAMFESNDIAEAVTKTLLWILGMQVIGAVGIGFLYRAPCLNPSEKHSNVLKGLIYRKKST